MSNTTLEITFADCRGWDTRFHYGFIYFNDGSWLGYLPCEDRKGVRFYAGRKDIGNSVKHYRVAARYLMKGW